VDISHLGIGHVLAGEGRKEIEGFSITSLLCYSTIRRSDGETRVERLL
jgi:hypothetical protein